MLTALVALMVGATRGQVRRAGDAILDNNSKLDTANSKLDTANSRLGTIDGKLDKLEKLDDLDRIQVELDNQTGVMDRQVRILEQIRDGVTG